MATTPISQSQVAAFLGISEGAVRKRLYDARHALKEQMIDMVKDTLHDEAPSRDRRFAEQVLRSTLPLQVFAVAGPHEARTDPHVITTRDLGSTTAGRHVDIPTGTVWFVEPRIDLQDDADFERLLSEMKERRIPGLRTGGRLTDRHLSRLAELGDHLLYLDVGGGNTGITDEGLRHLAKLPRLQHLGMNLNGPCNSPTLVPAEVTDAGLEFLGQLHELESLDLHNLFQISDSVMRHVARMPQLRHLGLHGTMVGDDGLAHLAGLEHLNALLPGPLTTDRGLEVLRELPAFHDTQSPRGYLGMGKSPLVGDRGLRTIADLPGLQSLWLCETRLMSDRWVSHLPADIARQAQYTGDGLESLARLPHLTEFSMSGDRQNDEALEHIGHFPALIALGCAQPVAGDRGWQGLARSRSLSRIGAFEAPGLTGKGLAALATIPQLVDLGMGGPNLHDEDLAPLSEMQNLKAFSADRGNVFTDAAYTHIARIPHLERLSTGTARAVGDAATSAIARMPHLRSLHLSGWKMTDHTCELLADAPALEDLSLRIRRLTDEGLSHLNACSTLKQLKLDDCPFVTEAGIGTLPSRFELDWHPGTIRQLIEAVIEDETLRDVGEAALKAHGETARHELEVFRDIVPEIVRPIFERLLDDLG